MNTYDQPVSDGTNSHDAEQYGVDNINTPDPCDDGHQLTPSPETPGNGETDNRGWEEWKPTDNRFCDTNAETPDQPQDRLQPRYGSFDPERDARDNVYPAATHDYSDPMANYLTIGEVDDMRRAAAKRRQTGGQSYWREVGRQIAEIEATSSNLILDPHAITSCNGPLTPQDLLDHRDDYAQVQPEPGSPAATENIVRRANYTLATTCLELTTELRKRAIPEDHDDQLRHIAKLHGIALTLKAVRDVTKPIVKLPKVPGRPPKRWS